MNILNFLIAAINCYRKRNDLVEVTETVFMYIKFMDPNTGKNRTERIELDLYGNTYPNTVKNFLALIVGHDGKGYKDSIFHRIIPGFMIQGGDIIYQNGTGSYSIYGDKFDDESFLIKHTTGCISMANSGPNTNGSQFFITTGETSWLNDKHVVFGKIRPKYLNKIKEIQNVKTGIGDRPVVDVKIIDCGVVESAGEKTIENEQEIDDPHQYA